MDLRRNTILETFDQLVDGNEPVAWAIVGAIDPTSRLAAARSAGLPLLANPDTEPWVTESLLVKVAAKFGLKDNRTNMGSYPETDEEWSIRFPPRTKSDLGIRRTRLRDLVAYARDIKAEMILRMTMDELGDFDYIAALNICWASLLFRHLKWFEFWKKTGTLRDSLSAFVSGAKSVSDVIKRGPCRMEHFLHLVENQSLAGYRNLPFPGFDYVAEARELAHGGLDHNLPPSSTFQALVDEALACPDVETDYIDFSDFVRSGQWLTAGSSSIGRMLVEFDGKVYKFKARKNTLPDIYEPEELITLCQNWIGQENSTLVKSELGKVRLAVAGDIATYLMMSWIIYLTGKCYLQWEGSTGQESVGELCDRLNSMMRLCKEGASLPFDFSKFDHQPKTEEITTIYQWFLNKARRNVPNSKLDAFESIAKRTLNGFALAILRYRDPTTGVGGKFNVTGGLMSGLRITSVVGDAWNLTMTRGVRKMLEAIGIDTSDISAFVRGDDSAIFSANVQKLRLFAEGYRRMGIIGGVGKFSVLRQNSEFLRTWICDRCLGYPVRVIPALTQRKPWSSEPWTGGGVITAIREACATLSRRGVNGDEVFRSLGRTWCRLHKLPLSVLSTPVHLGGLGLTSWDGRFIMKPALPTADVPPFKLVRTSLWRERNLAEVAEEYKFSVSDADLTEIATNQARTVLQADDVPAISKICRLHWRQELGESRRKTVKYTDLGSTLVTQITRMPEPLDKYQDLIDRLRRKHQLFGRFRHVLAELAKVRPFLRLLKIGVREWLAKAFPAVWELTRGSGSRLGDMLDYLGGEIKLNKGNQHPAITELVTLLTLESMPTSAWKKRGFSSRCVQLGSLVCENLKNSGWHTRLFSW